MSYSRRVFLNTLAQSFSRVFSIAVSIGTAMILTRYLGPDGYGRYNTAIGFVGLLAVLGDLGIYHILIRELSQNPSRREEILANVFAWRLLSSVLVLLVIAVAGWLMPYEKVVKLAILIETVRNSIYVLRTFFTSLPQVNLRLDLSAWGEIIGRGSFLLSVILVAVFHWSLLVLFILLLTTTVLETLWMFFSFKKLGGSLHLAWDSEFLKVFLKDSIILGFAYILGSMHFRLDTVLLSVMKPAEDVGIYSAAYRIFQTFVMLPAVFITVVYPRFAELAAKNRWSDFFRLSLRILWLAAWPLAILSFLYAPYMIRIIGGEAYSQSVIPLWLLSFAIVGGFMYAGFSQMAVALKRQKQVVLVAGMAVFVNVVLNLALIPAFSYSGAALATLVSECFAFIIFAFLFNRFLGFRIDYGYWLKIVFLALFVGVIARGLQWFLPYSEFALQSLPLAMLEIGLIWLACFLLYFVLAVKFNFLPRTILKEIIKR